MATKKSQAENNDKPGIIKVAEKIAYIAGTIVGKKNQLVRKGGEAIETVKTKLKDITGAKKSTAAKAKKLVKKTAVKAKKTARTAAKKGKAKVVATKKKAGKAARHVKKATKKASR